MRGLQLGTVAGALLLCACADSRPTDLRSAEVQAAGVHATDAALAARMSDELYRQGKGTPAEFASNQLASHEAWVYKRILLGRYKADDKPAQQVARTYATTLLADIDHGLAWPQRERPSLDLPHIAHAPTIDGVLNEDEWRGALTLHGEYLLGHLEPHAASTLWQLCWDEQYLYVAGRFADARITSIPFVAEQQRYPWDGDVCELFVLPDRRLKAYWEVVVSPDASVVDGLHLNNSAGGWVPGLDETLRGLRVATARTVDGYAVEMAVPFGELPGYMRDNRPHAGETIELTAIRIDDGVRSACAPLLYDGHNIFGYARCTLR